MASGKYDKFKAVIKETDPAASRAIQTKYQGDTGAIRKLWPLALGKDADGEEVALCYQYAGQGTNPPAPHVSFKNLRCLKLAKVLADTCTKIVFDSVAEGFDPPYLTFKQLKKQTCVDDVDIFRQSP